MPAKAGQIVIDVSAGTAKMIVDLEAAKGKLREFGQTAQGSARVASAEINAFKSGTIDSTRALAQFLTQTLKLGPALQVAFPIFGAAALAGVISDASKKVYEFFKALSEAPARASIAFGQTFSSIAQGNAAMEADTARIENQITKLMGYRENLLKGYFAEAREEALKLGETIEKDLDGLDKLLKGQDASLWKQLWGSTGRDTGDFQDAVLKARAEIARKETQTALGIRGLAPGNTAGADELQRQFEDFVTKTLGALSAQLSQQLQPHAETVINGGRSRTFTAAPVTGQAAQDIQDDLLTLQEMMQTIPDLRANRQAHVDLKSAQMDADDLKRLQELNNKQTEGAQRFAEMMQRIVDAASRASVSALPESQKIAVDASRQAAEFRANAQRILGSGPLNPEVEDAIQKYVDAMNASVAHAFEKERIQFNEMITRWAGEADRQTLDAQHPWLKQQESQRRLDDIALQSRRDALSRQASAAGIGAGSGQSGIDAAYAIRVKLAEQLNKLEQERIAKETDATKKLEEEARAHADLTRAYDEAAIEWRRQTEELRRHQVNQVTGPISQQLTALVTGQKTSFGKTFENLGREMVQKTIQEGLNKLATGKPDGSQGRPFWVKNADLAGANAGGGASAGTGPIGGAIATARHIWDSLHSIFHHPAAGAAGTKPAIPGLGPKPSYTAASWGPDGTEQNPFYVIVEGQSNRGGGSLAGLLGGSGGGLAALFGGGGAGLSSGLTESVSSSISFADIPALAEGSDSVTPGHSYWVGDGGEPELFTPRSAGSITPMHKMGGSVTYQVYAPGADLGAHNRISRGLEATHNASVHSSAVAQRERTKRTPQRSAR